MYKASLIISFYNKINYLEKVIDSLRYQTEKNFEVIISDDGSDKTVASRVEVLLEDAGLAFQYLWHDDMGWRKNIILNKSVQASQAELLIFIDGDCILHRRFIEEHVKMAEAGVVRAGRRVNMSERVSNKILTNKYNERYFGNRIVFDLLIDSILGKASHIEQGIYIKNKLLRASLNDKDKQLLGSNFSIFKQDLLDVNGYDERFDKPAVGEDTDLEARLRRNAIRFRGIRNQAIQYHFHHVQLPRAESNQVLYRENNENNISYTPYGIRRDRTD